jgi:hypothetical protein
VVTVEIDDPCVPDVPAAAVGSRTWPHGVVRDRSTACSRAC